MVHCFDGRIARYHKASRSAATQAEDDLALGTKIAVVLGPLNTVIGAMLVLFTSPSINGPICALTASMLELAEGKFDIVLPGLGRKMKSATSRRLWRNSS